MPLAAPVLIMVAGPMGCISQSKSLEKKSDVLPLSRQPISKCTTGCPIERSFHEVAPMLARWPAQFVIIDTWGEPLTAAAVRGDEPVTHFGLEPSHPLAYKRQLHPSHPPGAVPQHTSYQSSILCRP